MPVTTTIRIGADLIDLSQPCEVAAALKKMQIKLATGGLRETVRIDGEEITFQRADDKRLAGLIAEYAGECARLGGNVRRTRYAKRFTFR